PRPLAAAWAVERRLEGKRRGQVRAGGGREGFDWCDRLQGIATTLPPPAPHRSWTAIVAPERAAVVVIRIGGRVEGFVGTDAGVRADPEQAAVLLERAARAELAPDAPTHRPFLDRMLRQVRPLCRRRLDAVEATRWRAADRDRLSRRLIPWVLSAARRAAVQRRPADLRRLDELVSRLALGMTAGEELLLEDLGTRRTALSVRRAIRPALEPARTMPVVVAGVAQRIGMHPGLFGKLLEARQGDLGGPQSGLRLLASLFLSGLADAEPAQQRREREPLTDQRHDDHAVRDSDDRVPPGERSTGSRHDRNCGREDERVTAAEPRPTDDRHELPAWERLPGAQPRQHETA